MEPQYNQLTCASNNVHEVSLSDRKISQHSAQPFWMQKLDRGFWFKFRMPQQIFFFLTKNR